MSIGGNAALHGAVAGAAMAWSRPRSPRGSTALTFAALALAALPLPPAEGFSLGAVAVSFELDVAITGRDATGALWQALPDNVSKVACTTCSGGLRRTHFDGKLFKWRFSAGKDSFGHAILSKVDAPLCFRFDQARLTSNLQTKEIPLRVWRAYQGQEISQKISPTFPAKWNIHRFPGTGFVPSPAFCFQESKEESFLLALDLSEVFPNGHMFNVNWKGRDPTLTEQGIGNWLKIHVPIEYSGNREELEVTLTATKSHAWLVYY